MPRYGGGNQPGMFNRAVYLTSAAGTDWTTGNSPVTLFTVTGDVKVRIHGVVGATAVTSTSNDGTLEVGTTEDINAILTQVIANGTLLAATDVWTDSTPNFDVEGISPTWYAIGGGADIILTIATNSMTAGIVSMYCEWLPVSSNGNVVSTT